MRKVYIYYLTPRMHSSMKLMIDNPPKGYEFILPESKIKMSILRIMLNSKFIKFLYQKMIKNILNPFKLYNKIYSTKIPEGIDLVYSTSPLKINYPYIIEIIDHPAALAGYDYKLFIKNRKEIEKSLLSKFCQKIIVVNESSYKIVKKNFNKKVIKKTILIRATIEKKHFRKNYDKKKLQIIFIGSVANPDDFYVKGGLEAIESFSRISNDFENVSMMVRCKVPDEVSQKYRNVKGLKIIDYYLKLEELDKLMKNSDICLNLGHVYPLMTTLESLSYGIPMIMLDSWGVRDYLTNKKNAILIKPSSKITGYKSEDYPLNIRSQKFIEEIKNIDERVIQDVCVALKLLIKNKQLRKRLGKNGKKTAETKFSIEKRNTKLKKIFDQAINSKDF